MKTSALALLLTFLGAAPAMAQGLSFGVKAGVNIGKVTFGGAGERVPVSTRPGPLAGAWVTIPLGWVTVQPEALYTVKGASVDIADLEGSVVVDYLEVPVLARFSLPRGLYAAAGPSVGFRLRAKSRTNFGGSVEEMDLKEEVEPLDTGLVVALGMDVRRFVIDGRYTHGLSDIDADKTDDVTIRTRVFSLAVGFRF